MKTRHEIAELAVLLARRSKLSKCISANGIANDALALIRLGSQATTAATNLCNVANYQNTFEKRKASILARLAPFERAYNVTFEVGGDPRGCVLKMHAVKGSKPLAGNTWGGDESGYGI